MKKILLLTTIGLAAMGGVAFAQPEVAKTPAAVAEVFHKAWDNQDVDGLAALYDEDSVLVQGPGQPDVVGWENIKEVLRPFFSTTSKLDHVRSTIHEAEDSALVKAFWRITAPDGSVNAESHALEVLRRDENGNWVYAIDSPFEPGTY
ncbi:hypothetical protein GCM10007094_36290 [Pseudovibrio japonicus]|uniref:SnoaL-like domain-containing protein n=1 Tax=Pseudovibrio japonicus TaxID=366534 RepID=A0ABQ3EJW9_9HYPH|nr:SgcJ/EcaC family oxidoreductase [Pseudovibrio japonicus]GHB43610.1 hypothetical protein GCM10007094_36290 [Pseudovibrio japonicus]